MPYTLKRNYTAGVFRPFQEAITADTLMTQLGYRVPVLIVYCVAALWLNGCGGASSSKARGSPSTPRTVADAEVSDTAASIIRTLEERVLENPEDFIAFNKLSGYYLQRMRETGDAKYLDLASRAAQASIKILPAEINSGALTALAQVEFAAHDFTAARDHAIQLVKSDPRKSQPYLILADALLELGDYDQATEVFRQIQQLGGGGIGGETRLARFDMLRGKTDNARHRLENVLALALQEVPRERETIAWCRWQLGELAFSLGKYEDAERRYREALTDIPDYYRAVAGLARALAARGDLTAATTEAERSVRVLPDPSFVACLEISTVHPAGKKRRRHNIHSSNKSRASMTQAAYFTTANLHFLCRP